MRPFLLAVACLLATACSGDPIAPSGPSLRASYLLSSIDGEDLPCCSHVNSDGRTEQWSYSEVHFTGPDTYTWTVELRFDWQTGPQAFKTVLADSIVSAGHYARYGTTVSFSDSSTSRAFSAQIVDDTVSVAYQGTTYRFVAEAPPSLYQSNWAEGGCNNSTGNNPGCPMTDASGTVRTTIGGFIAFDLNADGHYVWATLYEDRHPGGITDTAQVSATGTYLWDGTTLSMKDGSTGATMTGHLAGGPLHMLIQSGASVAEFYRFVGPPTPALIPPSHD
jgi:hypothetical protein